MMEDSPWSTKNTTAESGERPTAEMEDLWHSSLVTEEKGLVLMVSKLSPSITSKQRKPSIWDTANNYLRLLLDSKFEILQLFI